MVHPLVGIHAAIGELGVASFLWVLIELLNPSKASLRRARIASVVGTLALCTAWLTGGYYYLVYYGPAIKPMIKAGAYPWVHSILMETKEHIFLFMPFLAMLTTALVHNFKKAYRKDIIRLCMLIILLGVLMMGFGYAISASARMALEAAV